MIFFSKMTNYADIVIDPGWISLLFPWGQLQHFAFPNSLKKKDMHYSKECNTGGGKKTKGSMHVYRPVSNTTPCGCV